MIKTILLTLLLAFPLACAAQDGNVNTAVDEKRELSKEDVVRIATTKAQELGFKMNEMESIYDEDNAKIKEHSRRSGVSVYNKKTDRWEKVLPSAPEKDFPALKGRNYQAVYFAPKVQQKGGDLWVFVDKNTGEVIQWVCGK